MMYGKHNRFDHNHLVGKSTVGVTMAVRLDSEESQENYHRIDHNYFGTPADPRLQRRRDSADWDQPPLAIQLLHGGRKQLLRPVQWRA